MILDIIPLGDPILRRKAHKISKVDNKIRLLANDMLETLRDSFGVGLAAPQIGESIRLIVIEYKEDVEGEEETPPKTYKLVNPEIIWRSEETVMGTEGCLSIKGLVGEVERAESVKIKGLSVYGRPVKISVSGWLARIFQHEIDHLDGICYVDRATTVWEIEKEETEGINPDQIDEPSETAAQI